MKIQLKYFVERYRNYTYQLDNFTILTDQPWVTKTENENERCVLIFRKKENELLISINGKVEKGKWDYIPSMKSLLIERKSSTTLYNQGFFDDSIMILKIDGTQDYQLFANENRVDKTIEKLLEETEKKYLETEENRQNKIPLEQKGIVVKNLPDGRRFEIHSSLNVGYTIGDKVTINGKSANDGKYNLGWFDTMVVEDGKLKQL